MSFISKYQRIASGIVSSLLVAMIVACSLPALAKDGVVEVLGPVKSLPVSGVVGDWVIGARTVRVNSATVIKQEIGPARVGAIVEAKATPQSDGTLLATRIEVQQAGTGGGGYLMIHGLIGSLPGTGNFVGDWTVGGRKITATSATRFDQTRGAFAVGARVEVEGYLQTDGTISAASIKTRPEDTAEYFKFFGTIGKLPAATNLIGDWTVSGRIVHVTSATQLEQERARFAVGVYVSVEAVPESDGSITAKELKSVLVSTVSAASFAGGKAAPDTIAAGFGTMLSTITQLGTTVPLPTNLGGTSVRVRDSLGSEREAHLFFVSPTQVNYLVPAGSATGLATVLISNERGDLVTGTLTVESTAPGLFSANSSGAGVAAAVALRIKPNGEQIYESVHVYDDNTKEFVPRQLDLGSDDVFLILYGTGLRHRSSLASSFGRAGGTDAQVTYVGAQGSFSGLDQVNLRLGRHLAGRGEIEVEVEVEGKRSNKVKVNVR